MIRTQYTIKEMKEMVQNLVMRGDDYEILMLEGYGPMANDYRNIAVDCSWEEYLNIRKDGGYGEGIIVLKSAMETPLEKAPLYINHAMESVRTVVKYRLKKGI